MLAAAVQRYDDTYGIYSDIPGRKNIVFVPLNYNEMGLKLEGTLAYNPDLQGSWPAVIVLNCISETCFDDAREIAKEIAAHGYAAFITDISGFDTDAGVVANFMSGAPDVRLDRLKAYLEETSTFGIMFSEPGRADGVDLKKLAAIGRCFGPGFSIGFMCKQSPLLRCVLH